MPESDRDRMSAIRPTSLTEENVIDIRNRNRWGESVQNLALLYRVGLTTIRDVLSRKTWSDVVQPDGLQPPAIRLRKVGVLLLGLSLLHSPRKPREGVLGFSGEAT